MFLNGAMWLFSSGIIVTPIKYPYTSIINKCIYE